MRDCARPLSLRFVILAFVIAAFALALPSGMAYAQDAQLGAANPALEAQNGEGNYRSPDGLVEVVGFSGGNVSYDEESATLTLDGVSAGSLRFCKDGEVTLNLVGSNGFDVLDQYERYENWMTEYDPYLPEVDRKGSVRIVGDGSLRGSVYIHGDLKLESETVELRERANDSYCEDSSLGVSCASLSVSGGSLVGDDCIRCSSLAMTSGSLSVGGEYGTISCSGAITMKGGSLTVVGGVGCSSLAVAGGKMVISEGNLGCSGAVTMKSGAISVGDDRSWSRLKCASLSVSGGKLDVTGYEGGNAIECKTLTMSAGAIKTTGAVKATSKLTVSGGTLTTTGGTSSNLYIGRGFYDMAVICPNVIVRGGAVKTSGVDCDTLTVWGGALNATGAIACLKIFNMKGGTVKAADGVHCGGNITVIKGKVNAPISCSRLTVKGGTVTLSNRKDLENAIYCENLVVNGGKITFSKLQSSAQVRCGKLIVKGGKISIGTCDGVGISCGNLSISKGSLLVDDQYDGESISVVGGSLAMTGGVLKVTRSYGDAIAVRPLKTESVTYRGRTTPEKISGGWATIKGGSVTVGTRRSPSRFSAIAARAFSGKASCVKRARGMMPKGFTFVAGGNTYQIVAERSDWASSYEVDANHWRLKAGRGDNANWYADSGYDYPSGESGSVGGSYGIGYLGKHPSVILTKYGSAKARASLGTVKFGSCNYSVSGVGPKAFGTPRGAKVKSITFSNTLTRVDANAFNGAKSLEELRLDLFVDFAYRKGTLSSATIWYPSKVGKAALSKCGKAGGKGLTVRIAPSSYYGYAASSSSDGKKMQDPRVPKLKAMLVKYGLSKSATVAIWDR